MQRKCHIDSIIDTLYERKTALSIHYPLFGVERLEIWKLRTRYVAVSLFVKRTDGPVEPDKLGL